MTAITRMMLATVVLLTFCAGAWAETEAPSEQKLDPCEARMLAILNAERASYDLPPLKIDWELQKSARKHCAWMARADSLNHTNDPVAENIAWGQTSPADAFDSWMNSSGHRANILTGGYTHTGVAAYHAVYSDGYTGQTYWCNQFK